MSSQDEGWRRPDYPQWSGEPAEGPDILEQGRDRPPTRSRLAVRWRRPPTVAISLGVAALFVGLAAGYAAGTLHAEKVPASSAQSGATASPVLSPVLNGAAPSQVQLWCAAPPGVAFSPDGRLDTPLTVVPPTTPHSWAIIISPSSPELSLTCRQ